MAKGCESEAASGNTETNKHQSAPYHFCLVHYTDTVIVLLYNTHKACNDENWCNGIIIRFMMQGFSTEATLDLNTSNLADGFFGVFLMISTSHFNHWVSRSVWKYNVMDQILKFCTIKPLSVSSMDIKLYPNTWLHAITEACHLHACHQWISLTSRILGA